MGAGGTNGGAVRFLVGVIMMIGGGYLFLNAVHVDQMPRWGHNLYSMGSFSITSGMVLIPFMFGVGIIFYNAKNVLGWLLAGGSLVALVFGIIASIHFSFRQMTAFELIVILVLLVGGVGLFLNGLKEFGEPEENQ